MKLELTRLALRSRGKLLAPFDLHIGANSPASAYAIVHEDERTLDSLLAVLSGSERPERGIVRVAGKDPSSTPAVRGRILGTYFREPEHGLAERIVAHRREVAHIRERAGILTSDVSEALLVPGDARLVDLSESERRRLALEMGLRLVEPLAVCLAEPLRDLDAVEARALLTALSRHTDRRAPCVFACTSRESAARLTPHIIALRSEGKA